jgi:hypothetical protein
MPIKLNKLIRLTAALWLAPLCAIGATDVPAPQVLISVPDQKLAVVMDGELLARYPISTSKFGTGDQFASYKTPLGQLKVWEKIGGNLPSGAVIHRRAATGEVLPVNAPGRDPIVTRVIWLDGLEAQNKNARSRCIYIHGTPDEKTIGTPVSWGCIRMRSKDVIKVFDEVPIGTVVSIIPDKLPHMHRYEPPKEQPAAPASSTVTLFASNPTPKPPVTQAKPAPPLKTPEIAQQAPAALPPPIGEGPDHENSAWHALKGSFLLANLLPWSDEHRKKATQ